MRLFYFILVLVWLTSSAKAREPEKYWFYHNDTSRLFLASYLADWTEKESYYSTWLNASSLQADPQTAVKLRKLFPFLTLEHAGDPLQSGNSVNDTIYSYALEQIRAAAFSDRGFTGKGVKVGVIDGGFLGADKHPALAHIFRNGQVAAYRDFITPDQPEYSGKPALDDQHGTEVLTALAGYSPETGVQHGMATGATFYLARTDRGDLESRTEEEYFIRALEWLHSQGVRLVNSSLGYTNGYTIASENYTPDQMNGSSAIARAVEIAATEKNMIIVTAAGNEGNLPWRVVNTPGDAAHAITVGSAKYGITDKTGYSSKGPDFLDYLKPELTCFAYNGTSFSAPVITGLVACMLEAKPGLSVDEVRQLLFSSARLFPYGNNHTGYGVPDARKILQTMTGVVPESTVQVLVTRKKRIRIPADREALVIFHKRNGWRVLKKEIIPHAGKEHKVSKIPGAESVTVSGKNRTWEIIWE